MAGEQGYLLSEQAIRKLMDDHRRLAHEVYQLKQQLASTHRPPPWPRELYWGKTKADSPDEGNTFEVELIDRTFEETVGDQDVVDTIPDNPVVVTARTLDGCHVPAESIVMVERRLSREGWRYWILPGPLLYEATATDDFCDTEPVDCDHVEPLGWCDESYSYAPSLKVSAKPKFGVVGCAGDKVLLVKFAGGEQKFAIIAGTLRPTELLESAYYDSCELQFPKKTVYSLSCCADDPPPDSLTMYEHTYYGELSLVHEYTESMDPQNSICELKLKGKTSTICAFEPQTLGSLTTLSTITLENLEVGLPVTDDGNCLQQATQWVWVICAADPSDPTDVLCLEECGGGSGSA